ncbi:MAG: class I SAM-dependent methyltransferase [Pseudomonadota bacterium]
MATSPFTGTPGRLLFEHDVLGRHRARYFMDDTCKGIWVESPHWLEEAYSDAIALTDTGMLARNAICAKIVGNTLAEADLWQTPVIDAGGGHGIFVRMMRDMGFDFWWSDKFAANIAARGFEARDDATYPVATAFEVLEHLPSPPEFLSDLVARHGTETILFSATLFDPDNVPGADWWYWAFETGQHIAFFSRQTLDWMAGEIGMTCLHLHKDIYAFTTRSDLTYPSALARWKNAQKFRRRSRVNSDYAAMKATLPGAR